MLLGSVGTRSRCPAHAMLKRIARPYGATAPATTGCWLMAFKGIVNVNDGPVGSDVRSRLLGAPPPAPPSPSAPANSVKHA